MCRGPEHGHPASSFLTAVLQRCVSLHIWNFSFISLEGSYPYFSLLFFSSFLLDFQKELFVESKHPWHWGEGWLQVKVSNNLPISTSKDIKPYGELIKQMASRLGIPYIECWAPVENIVFDVFQKHLSSNAALSLTPNLLRWLGNIPHLLWCHLRGWTICTISKNL